MFPKKNYRYCTVPVPVYLVLLYPCMIEFYFFSKTKDEIDYSKCYKTISMPFSWYCIFFELTQRDFGLVLVLVFWFWTFWYLVFWLYYEFRNNWNQNRVGPKKPRNCSKYLDWDFCQFFVVLHKLRHDCIMKLHGPSPQITKKTKHGNLYNDQSTLKSWKMLKNR